MQTIIRLRWDGNAGVATHGNVPLEIPDGACPMMPFVERIYWEVNHGGFATVGSRRTPLDVPPVIDGVPPYEMIDFVPGGVVQIIRPLHERQRDLLGDEPKACKRWLDSLTGLWQ